MKKWWITYELDFYNPGEEPKGRPSPFLPAKTCNGVVTGAPGQTAFYAGEDALRTLRGWVESGEYEIVALAGETHGLVPDMQSLRVIKAEERG